jgi:hypothetical protein
MPTANEIAERARALVHEAAAELAAFIGPVDLATTVDAEMLLANRASEEGEVDAHLRASSWERHAALNILLAARCIAGLYDTP